MIFNNRKEESEKKREKEAISGMTPILRHSIVCGHFQQTMMTILQSGVAAAPDDSLAPSIHKMIQLLKSVLVFYFSSAF